MIKFMLKYFLVFSIACSTFAMEYSFFSEQHSQALPTSVFFYLTTLSKVPGHALAAGNSIVSEINLILIEPVIKIKPVSKNGDSFSQSTRIEFSVTSFADVSDLWQAINTSIHHNWVGCVRKWGDIELQISQLQSAGTN